jgi:hypothetical protein
MLCCSIAPACRWRRPRAWVKGERVPLYGSSDAGLASGHALVVLFIRGGWLCPLPSFLLRCVFFLQLQFDVVVVPAMVVVSVIFPAVSDGTPFGSLAPSFPMCSWGTPSPPDGMVPFDPGRGKRFSFRRRRWWRLDLDLPSGCGRRHGPVASPSSPCIPSALLDV